MPLAHQRSGLQPPDPSRLAHHQRGQPHRQAERTTLALLAKKGSPTGGYYSESWDDLPVTPLATGAGLVELILMFGTILVAGGLYDARRCNPDVTPPHQVLPRCLVSP